MKDIYHHARVNPPDSFQDDILEMASKGYSRQGCAHRFGVSLHTFNRWLEESDQFTEAFARGRERERQTLHGGLYRAAENGNIVAAMFLLKTKHNYREQGQQEAPNKVNITFNLPGAMTPEQYRTINAVVTPKQVIGGN